MTLKSYQRNYVHTIKTKWDETLGSVFNLILKGKTIIVSFGSLGDSGGPAQNEHSYSSLRGFSMKFYELIAVTSFGVFCGTEIPGVYTRVQPYLDWIEKVVWP